jgi:hypothetical protein
MGDGFTGPERTRTLFGCVRSPDALLIGNADPHHIMITGTERSGAKFRVIEAEIGAHELLIALFWAQSCNRRIPKHIHYSLNYVYNTYIL